MSWEGYLSGYILAIVVCYLNKVDDGSPELPYDIRAIKFNICTSMQI